MTALPSLYPDEPSCLAVEPREVTRSYDHTLRAPALPLYHRWPVLAGFLAGAPVEAIAEGLSRGERWEVGPAPFAPLDTGIWLLDLEVSYRDQIAAWRVRDPAHAPIEPDPLPDFDAD